MENEPITLLEGAAILAKAALNVRWGKIDVSVFRKVSPEELGLRIEKLFEDPSAESADKE